MLAVIPIFMSPPKSPSKSFDSGSASVKSLVRLEVAYGLISMFLPAEGRSRPTRSPAADTRKMLVEPPVDAGTNAR